MGSTLMNINKGNEHGTQRERTKGAQNAETWLLKWVKDNLWKSKHHTSSMFPTKGDLTMKMKHGPQKFERIRVLLKKKKEMII